MHFRFYSPQLLHYYCVCLKCVVNQCTTLSCPLLRAACNAQLLNPPASWAVKPKCSVNHCAVLKCPFSQAPCKAQLSFARTSSEVNLKCSVNHCAMLKCPWTHACCSAQFPFARASASVNSKCETSHCTVVKCPLLQACSNAQLLSSSAAGLNVKRKSLCISSNRSPQPARASSIVRPKWETSHWAVLRWPLAQAYLSAALCSTRASSDVN